MENAVWLITLPACRSNNNYLPVTTLLVERKQAETYAPSFHDDGSQILIKRQCTFYCSWRARDGRPQQMHYPATYTAPLLGTPGKLDLVHNDFVIDYDLRGRGLGTWLIQQLIRWAKSQPPDTRVVAIETSPVDEADPDNPPRRDRLWHGAGFRFTDGARRAQPLRISDLCQRSPDEPNKGLLAMPLFEGIDNLIQDRDQLTYQIKELRYQIQQHEEAGQSMPRLNPLLRLSGWCRRLTRRHSGGES